MKLTSIAAVFQFAALGMAADQDEVDFLTALVSDYNEHRTEYFSFIRTATGYPPDLTRLALQIGGYTDNSYTTLLDGDVNGESLMSYATNLPWYSRVAAAAGIDSADESGSSGSSSSGSASASSATLTGGSGIYLAPAGALLGAAALVLL